LKIKGKTAKIDLIAPIVMEEIGRRRGFDNRISQSRLSSICSRAINTKVTDREIEKAVQVLKLSRPGCMIASTVKEGGGYFMVETKRGLLYWLKAEIVRIRENSRRIREQLHLAGMEEDEVEQLWLPGFAFDEEDPESGYRFQVTEGGQIKFL
jgi:hypothetical protein